MNPKHDAIIERFGAAIAELHEWKVESARHTLRVIASPENDHDRAISNYYSRMSRDESMIALAQNSIEEVLHDLFFLFAENRDFKIVLEAKDGTRINLVDAVDEIQAFPGEWIERKSSAGFEIGRMVDFLDENLPEESVREREVTASGEGEESSRDV